MEPWLALGREGLGPTCGQRLRLLDLASALSAAAVHAGDRAPHAMPRAELLTEQTEVESALSRRADPTR